MVKLFPDDKKERKQTDLVRVVTWASVDKGGIHEELIPFDELPPNAVEWTVLGIKRYYRGHHVDGRYVAMLPPAEIKLTPRNVGDMIDCIPLQKLNATAQNIWQMITAWAPVVVIGIGCLLLIIMVG